MFKKQFSEVEDACALAQAMVDTVREPLIVLDKDLRVIAASRSFYVKFATNPDNSQASIFTSWAMASGTSQGYEHSWKTSYPTTAGWMIMKLSMTFLMSENAYCC